jgi:preprotein translocase subunit SecD
MMTRARAFNLYLVLAILLSAGCQTTEERNRKKEATTLRLHLSARADGTKRTGSVPIGRDNPFYLGVEHGFFLDETEIVRADLVEAIGGFSIQVQFSRHGTFVLDQVTSANRGKRIAVFTIFDESRWLAAPEITHRIASGIFTFTPDATREEAERIVRGLNNVAETIRKRNRF